MAIDHQEVLDALKTRVPWENRQANWYMMRTEGLRRKNKPWPNAADMHFPLVDMLIEKLKPFYIAQVFATDTIASFTGLDVNSSAWQNSVGQWFDYKLKQHTNFEFEIVIGADRMLQSGKCPVKVYWDAEAKQLVFEAINPLYLIVPPWTGRLAKADWVVHVQHYSKAAYMRLEGFKKDADTIRKITESSGTTNLYETARYQREGLTHPRQKDTVVIWEAHSHDDDGKVLVETYSPAAPDLKLRGDFNLPYNKGLFADDLQPLPFFELSAEMKDAGYYDARGVTERVAAFETSLCKDWNTQKDHQTLTCAPVFTATSGVPNTANLRMVPGQILPFALQAVTMPSMPTDLMANMQQARQVAEQLIAIPDFGTGNQVQPDQRKTAREVSLIANVMGQNLDLRNRVFKREMDYGLNLAFSILIQYEEKELNYFFLDELLELPPEAINGKYRIELNGSGDNFNRQFVLQKAQARFQFFKGDPKINQDELYRSLLDADDPRLTKRLLLNTGTQSAQQMEEQAEEISIMMLGFPAQVKAADDDAAHLQSMKGFLTRRLQYKEPLSGEVLTLMAQHADAHVMALKQKAPQQFQQQGAQWLQFVQQIMAAAQAAMPHATAPMASGAAPAPQLGQPAGTPSPMPAGTGAPAGQMIPFPAAAAGGAV